MVNQHAQNNISIENVFNRSIQSSKAFNDSQTISNIFNPSYRDNQIIVKGIVQPKGFATGGFTGNGNKNDFAGIVHKGEVVFSQEDVKRNGGVAAVEAIRKTGQSLDYSDLFHDGKIYFSSEGIIQDRSVIEDVQDFTSGQYAYPQSEAMPKIQTTSPAINFKIEVVNQFKGATVEAEQLDENTIRLIVKDEMDREMPRRIPKQVSDDLDNPNSLISRSLTRNTTSKRNR